MNQWFLDLPHSPSQHPVYRSNHPYRFEREDMIYATVMVSLALDRSNDACLEIAGQLAKRFNAAVIGIAAGEFSPPLYFTTGDQAQRVIDQGQVVIRNHIAEV